MKIPQISRTKAIMFIMVCLFAANLIHAAYSELAWASNLGKGKAFVKVLGHMGLSLPTECLSARNPVFEPICLADIPGGYCYHQSCAKVAPIYIGKEYTIEVVNNAETSDS